MSFDKDAFKGNLRSRLSLNPLKSAKASAEIDPGNIFRTGRTAAEKTQKAQSLLIEKQRQREELRLAEETSEIARRKTLAKSARGGRRSLIKTSEAGVGAVNLGATT